MNERLQRTQRDLLRAAILTSVPQVPAQFDEVEWKFVYVPAWHARALEPNTMLVTGIRGAGKSFWWYLLQDQSIRDQVVGKGISISVGFGQRPSADWPDRDELRQLLQLGYKPRLIWKTVVLRHLAGDLRYEDRSGGHEPSSIPPSGSVFLAIGAAMGLRDMLNR